MKLSETQIIKPPALPKNGRIGVIAPSSAVRPESLKRGFKFLEDLGYKIILGKTITNVFSKDFNSANDNVRLDELMSFFNRDDIDAIFTATGGYGTTRILDKIDYGLIARKPKILMGFSDTTGLQLAIWKKANVITFAGPTPEMSSNYFEVDKWNLINALNILSNKRNDFEIDLPPHALPRVIGNHDGMAKGRLIGGNLTLITSLLGTEFDPALVNNILFFEEVGESVLSIERMIQHLKLAHKLDYLAGVIIGELSNITRETSGKERDPGFGEPSVEETLLEQFSAYKYPIVYDYNFHHGKYCLTLPVGAMAEIDTPNTYILENVIE